MNVLLEAEDFSRHNGDALLFEKIVYGFGALIRVILGIACHADWFRDDSPIILLP
jgi:hypothetical protein